MGHLARIYSATQGEDAFRKLRQGLKLASPIMTMPQFIISVGVDFPAEGKLGPLKTAVSTWSIWM